MQVQTHGDTSSNRVDIPKDEVILVAASDLPLYCP